MKRRYARMMTREIPNLGLQYLIDEIKAISEEEAMLINNESETEQSIWIPIPDNLFDKWVDELYVGDKNAVRKALAA